MTAIRPTGSGTGPRSPSLIGARGDNGLGITGVAWRVRLMPVKVLHDRGWGTTVTLITGLRYALANGARIINLSVNGSEPSQALEEAIRQAEAQGALVVTSAGNDGQDRDQVASYPASIDSPALLTVTSATRSGALGSQSAYGAGVDIAAPGDGVLTGRPERRASGRSQAPPSPPHTSPAPPPCWRPRARARAERSCAMRWFGPPAAAAAWTAGSRAAGST